MLRDPIDFDYAIAKVREKMDLNIELQDELMDSKKMNDTFKSIEKNLNKLYEDTRYIQDAIDYCKTFLTVKIDEYSDDIYTVVKSIENIADVNKNMSYIEIPVKFIDNKVSIPDRNHNYTINSNTVKNNSLVLGTKLDHEWEIKTVTRKSDSVPYYENLDKIKDESYRAIYVEEKSAGSGLKETLTVALTGPKEVNFLDIAPVNCKIENVRYIYINGIEEYIGDLETGIVPESRVITHIKFDIVCDKYSRSVYTVEKDKITDNLWNKIKEYEYNSSINSATSKLEAEGIISRVHTDSKGTQTKEVFKKASGGTTQISMYTYSFGLDYLDVKRVVQYEDGYFISDPISVGVMNEKEYIQLNVNDTDEDGFGVEYSIIDGDREIHMTPVGTEHIENERIFPETDIIYHMDESEEYIIKKDGVTTDISLENAKLQYRNRYSIDYYPSMKFNYTPINTDVRVKAVMRTFGKYREFTPEIKKIVIRKYGGDNLWINKY